MGRSSFGSSFSLSYDFRYISPTGIPLIRATSDFSLTSSPPCFGSLICLLMRVCDPGPFLLADWDESFVATPTFHYGPFALRCLFVPRKAPISVPGASYPFCFFVIAPPSIQFCLRCVPYLPPSGSNLHACHGRVQQRSNGYDTPLTSPFFPLIVDQFLPCPRQHGLSHTSSLAARIDAPPSCCPPA